MAFSLRKGYSQWRVRAGFISKVVLELVPKDGGVLNAVSGKKCILRRTEVSGQDNIDLFQNVVSCPELSGSENVSQMMLRS